MRYIISTLILSCFALVSFADNEVPTIYKMWSRQEGIKNFVFDFSKDSASINFSEKDKWSASNIQFFSLNKIINKGNFQRIILLKDSAEFQIYRTIDIFNLTLDSLRIFLHAQYFADLNSAENVNSVKISDTQLFFTTEFLYLKKVEEKAPALKKTEYINFLKDAQAEAKKRATAKTLNLDPKRPIDKRVEDFLFDFSKEKQYRGKIFNSNLQKAMKNFEKDETVKKLYGALKLNFVVKKNPNAASTETAPNNSKASGNTNIKTSDKKENSKNELIISTDGQNNTTKPKVK